MASAVQSEDREALGWVEGGMCMKQGISSLWKSPLEWKQGGFNAREGQVRDKAGDLAATSQLSALSRVGWAFICCMISGKS